MCIRDSLFSLGLVPKLGRMKKAYRRVEETGKVYSPESAELNLEDEDDSPAITGCLWDFVLPIGTLIALTIVGGELFLALVAAIAVCFLLYIPRKKLSLTRFCDLAMHGFCNMIPTVAIIFFAFVMQEGMTEIGIAPFVINAVKSILSPAVFPAIAFLVVAALNFKMCIRDRTRAHGGPWWSTGTRCSRRGRGTICGSTG